MFKEIDPKSYIAEGLQDGSLQINYYAKFARIKARQGKIGEEIITIMKNGLKETRNIVSLDETGQPGWVVTNPSGEEYIVPNEKFLEKYEIDERDEEHYKPKGKVITAIQVKEDVSFVASWGEKMNIKKGGYLVINNPNDIYGIQEDEFNKTYKTCTKTGLFLDDDIAKTRGNKTL